MSNEKEIISKGQIEEIKNYLTIELQKRGVWKPEIEIEFSDGRVRFQTSDVQMNPPIFKRLYFTSFGGGEPKYYDTNGKCNIYTVFFSVNARWESYSGGENGSTLFDIDFIFEQGKNYVQIKGIR